MTLTSRAWLCPDCGVEPVERASLVCEPCRALRRSPHVRLEIETTGPVLDLLSGLESELAALVGAPEPSALRLYLAELVRERDRWAARVAVLEGRLARVRALVGESEDPALAEIDRLRRSVDEQRSALVECARHAYGALSPGQDPTLYTPPPAEVPELVRVAIEKGARP